MDSHPTPHPNSERGGGGKFRKPPPPRNPPSKPYDRPPPLATPAPPQQQQGFFSKIASKYLPSFLSSSSIFDNRDDDVEVEPPKRDGGRYDSSEAVASSSGAHPNQATESLMRLPEPGEHGKGKQICTSEMSEISQIEQLIKGRTFSRDQVDQLIEILNSKTLDDHEAERGTSERMTTAVVESEGPLTHQGRAEDNNRAMPGTPLPQLKVGDEIGASPIDIAKAFMESRNLDTGATPRTVSAKAEETMQLIESATNPLVPSPSRVASPHWPNIMVADQHDYSTPLSHKGRYGLHDFPRTPYSRTIYSKSRAKPQADNRYPSSSSNFFQKSRTPIYGQTKKRDDVLQDRHGTAGPIRRMRSRFSSESRSRGSIFSKPVVDVPSGSKVLPVEKNLEPNDSRNNSKGLPVGIGPSGSEEASSFLNPSTMLAVKRILDQLDSHKPTPKEKAAEIERCTAWRKSVPYVRSDDLGKATTSLSHDNKVDLVSELNDGNTTSDVQVKSPDVAMKETKIAAQGLVSTSNLDVVSGIKKPVSAEFSSHFDSISGSAAQNSPEHASNGMGRRLQKETSKHQIDNGTYAQSYSNQLLSKRPVTDTSSKPILSSIAISKPDPRRVVSSDNGNFTFPVSVSFGVMSEPPTPSIMPSSSSTAASSIQTLSSAVPSYTFGSKRASPPLVFSFPGGSTPSSDDASDLKFNFGSDKNSRISFKSVGKGAMCF